MKILTPLNEAYEDNFLIYPWVNLDYELNLLEVALFARCK